MAGHPEAENVVGIAAGSRQDETGAWIGNIETHTYSGADGCNFQNIIEAGSAFTPFVQ